MRLRCCLIFILVILSAFSFGQSTLIHGISEDYANEKIAIDYIFNPITDNAITLDTISIDMDGKFSSELSLEGLTWVQLELGVYKCLLLIMPGHSYEISLPRRRDKTEAEIRSIFFESTIIYLSIVNDVIINENFTLQKNCDLNSKIFTFDTLLYRINDDQLIARSRKKSFPIDLLIDSLENSYENDTSTYFSKYRMYRYGLIQMNSGIKSLKKIYDGYLSEGSPDLYNPAYFDLFSKMYEKFFYYFSRTEDGVNLNDIINAKHSLSDLRIELKKHNSIPNDTIADLVIMKEVNESFYQDYYYKEALLIILDSIIESPVIPIHSMLASDIRARLSKLMIGTKAPDFKLINQLGKHTSLEDLKGKYVFLVFCTTDNYSCLKEYPFMKALHEKHSDYLEITTVMVTETLANMQDFMKRNRFSWLSLFYGNNEELLESYNVSTFPTCFLIGPDGLLIQSPATLPTEGLEQQLFRIMRSRGDL